MIVVGIDEVGRGPIAGPVVLCGFTSASSEEALLSLFPQRILRDSKKLSEKRREEIYEAVIQLQSEAAVDFVTAERSATEIDERGISVCIKECVNEILDSLCRRKAVRPEDTYVYLDGSLKAGQGFVSQETIIKGDEKNLYIAYASIIAKVTRDRYMKEQATLFPGYGFENHVGYGTKKYILALQELGLSPLHRKIYLTSLKL